jgi:hypothetical protein
MIIKADLTDAQGRLRIIEIETTKKLTELELKAILAKELPEWRLLTNWCG